MSATCRGDPLRQVLLLGDINLDALMPVLEYPVPGRDGMAQAIHLRVGGTAANTAVMLKRLGLSAELLASTGQDLWADYVLAPLHGLGIDLCGVWQNPEMTTGLTFIAVTPDGERTMFSYRGANIGFSPSQISPAAFDHASLLQISGYAFLEPPQQLAAWQAVNLARQHGVPVSLDTGLEPVVRAPKEIRRLLPDLDVCILGMSEAEVLFGARTAEEALTALLSAGVLSGCNQDGQSGLCCGRFSTVL